MKILLRSSGFSFIILLLWILSSCKKDSYITIEGRLLISNTNPVPVSNYNISFNQAGSPGVPFPMQTTSSEGSVITDNNGNFSTKFKLGKSTFILLSSTNSNSISMSGGPIGNLPGFFINNIPTEAGTIYLYKKIDTAFLALNSFSTIVNPNDSLFINYHSTSGFIQKIKTGIAIQAGVNGLVFDTIINLALPYYDFVEKKYQNDVFIQLRKPGISYPFLMSTISDAIGPGDEQRRQLLFYFQ
jgi:hypothetical protein